MWKIWKIGQFWPGAVLCWGRGGMCSQIHLLSPNSKASWPFWRDFWGPKMLQNPNFPGLRPEPRWGSLQRSPDLITDGEGARCTTPKNPIPPSVLRASFLQASGSNITQLATVLMIDFKYRPIWSSYFFDFGERKKWTRRWMSWWGNAPPPQNFCSRTAPDFEEVMTKQLVSIHFWITRNTSDTDNQPKLS